MSCGVVEGHSRGERVIWEQPACMHEKTAVTSVAVRRVLFHKIDNVSPGLWIDIVCAQTLLLTYVPHKKLFI